MIKSLSYYYFTFLKSYYRENTFITGAAIYRKQIIRIDAAESLNVKENTIIYHRLDKTR